MNRSNKAGAILKSVDGLIVSQEFFIAALQQNLRRFPPESFMLEFTIVRKDRLIIFFFNFSAAGGKVVMNGKPRRPRRKSGLRLRRPLHGSPGIVPAVELYDLQGFCRFKTFLQSHLILAMSRNIVIVFNPFKRRIGHA